MLHHERWSSTENSFDRGATLAAGKRVSRRHLCNSTAAAAAAFRFDVSARLRLLMARRYGVMRPPSAHCPREEKRGEERRGGGAGAQRKVRRHQSYKRIKGCTPRAFMDGRCSSRGGEKGEGEERMERTSEREREREKEGTHALSKCATLWAPLGTLARSSLVVPILPSSSSFCPRAAVRSYQIFSFFFPLFFFSLPPSPLTPPRLSLSLSTGVSRVLVSDHRQVDNLFGAEGEEGGKRESVVPLSSVPSVNGTSQWGFWCGFCAG